MDVDHQILDFLMGFKEPPLLIAFLIFLTTFILEDAATSAAGLLASDGILPLSLAFAALMSGIVMGDLGLYGLGFLARKWDFAKRILERKGMQNTREFLNDKIIAVVILARFVPGMRLPTYAAMGLWAMNFQVFALTVVLAVGAWSTLLFGLFFGLGHLFMGMMGIWRWAGIGAVVVLALAAPRLIGWILAKPRTQRIKVDK